MIDGVFGKRVPIRNYQRTFTVSPSVSDATQDLEVTAAQIGLAAEEVLVLTHLAFFSMPNGGENITQITGALLNENLASMATSFPDHPGRIILANTSVAGVANGVVSVFYYGEMPLFPRWRIAMRVIKNAGLNPSDVGISVCGFIIPRVNLQA